MKYQAIIDVLVPQEHYFIGENTSILGVEIVYQRPGSCHVTSWYSLLCVGRKWFNSGFSQSVVWCTLTNAVLHHFVKKMSMLEEAFEEG